MAASRQHSRRRAIVRASTQRLPKGHRLVNLVDSVHMIAADSTGTAWLTIGASTIGALAGITGAWLGSWINQKAQDRRAYDDLRHELVEQMTAAAAAFYLQAQMYWRTLDGMLGGYIDLSEARSALDTQYSKSRVEGATLEARLTAYYRSDAPRLLWHQVSDLLEIYYFDLVGQATDEVRQRLAGPRHTGLTADELKTRTVVVSAYHAALRGAAHAALLEPLTFGHRHAPRRDS
jgi:hypothetical protein